MAKKRTPVPGPSPVSKAETGEGGEYTVGVWSGVPQYKCKRCAFDTLAGPVAILEHLVRTHDSMSALEALEALESPATEPLLTVRSGEQAAAADLLKEKDDDESDANQN